MELAAFSVSVAIPAHNEAGRIGDAIESVRAQTEPPVEIVVVDDGSDDDTAEVARRAGARVVRQVKGGPAAARNRAIREATSAWIALCDADDLWLPRKLELARRAHEARPAAGFIFGDCANVATGRIVTPSVFAERPEYAAHVSDRPVRGVAYFERDALVRGLAQRNFVATSTVVVRRGLVLEHDVFFDETLARDARAVVPEDLDWYLRMLRYTDALAVEEVVEHYRRHAGSLAADPARVHVGLVDLEAIVAARPERYPEAAVRAFAVHRRSHVRDAAVACARAGRFREASTLIARAQRERFDWRDQLLAVAAGAAALSGASRDHGPR